MDKYLLVLKVGNELAKGKSPYEATKGDWVLSKAKVINKEIEYVAGFDNVDKRIIVGVYKPEKWYEVVWADKKIFPDFERELGRFHFHGTELPEVYVENLNKVCDSLLERFGVGSEKAYIPLSELEGILPPYTEE